MNPNLSLVTLFILAITNISKCESPSNTTTFNYLTEEFQNLVTHSQSSKNEYLKFISSIEKFTHENLSQMATLSEEQGKVLKLMNAAAVTKILSKLDRPFNEELLEIQSKIYSLEHDTVTLAKYIWNEKSRLESEISSTITTTDNTNLFNRITHLKSMFQQSSNNISSANIDSLVTSKSQVLTLNLVQIYVCTANPVRKFHDIQRASGVVSSSTVANSSNATDTGHYFQITPICLESIANFHSRLSSAGHNLITAHPHETEAVRGPHTKFNNVHISRIVNQEQLLDFITAAAQLESSLNDLITNLNAHVAQPHHLPEQTNLHFLASFYELSDPTYMSQHVNNSEEIDSRLEKLRNLRQRLYRAIKLSVIPHTSKDTATAEIHGGFDEHVARDTLSGMSPFNSKCLSKLEEQMSFINSKQFETQLSKLNYFAYMNQLSYLMMTNVNTSKVHSNVKTLATLCEQTIKTSLLQIEYNQLLQQLQTDKSETAAQPTRVKSYTFTITESQSCAPDNYVQPCYLINDQFPGPSIVVNQHDLLRVTVINRLSVPTTMHFHGILQKHTVSSDGVAHVTQDPILPNHTYVYDMHIGDQSGTYMYHGHVGLDLVWLHGALIVRENAEEWKSLGSQYAYDAEHTYMLEEVFHTSFDQLIKEMRENGTDDPHVDSFAINGKSFGMWATNQGNSSSGYSTLTVTPGQTYRIRVINNAAGSMLHFTIQNHSMTVIEMDGIITEPVSTDRLELHTGQRYSVLVKMDRKVANYWVRARLMGEDGGADNGRAILHYDCAEKVGEMRTRIFPNDSDPMDITGDGWILDQLMPNAQFHQKGVYDFPTKSDKQILIDMQMRTIDGPPRFLVNGKLFKKPKRSYLESVRNGDGLSNDTHVFPIKEGEVIDLVFQNRVDDTGGCDEHPIHLHGHSFWVVTSGADEVNMNTIETQLSQESGNQRQFRDTFTLFPNSTVESETSGTACGWAVVRFVANNPGLWLVHCHVTSHMILGKMFVLYEYSENNMRLVNE